MRINRIRAVAVTVLSQRGKDFICLDYKGVGSLLQRVRKACKGRGEASKHANIRASAAHHISLRLIACWHFQSNVYPCSREQPETNNTCGRELTYIGACVTQRSSASRSWQNKTTNLGPFCSSLYLVDRPVSSKSFKVEKRLQHRGPETLCLLASVSQSH